MAIKKSITLKDIAKDTNFSITTVSHVINKTRHVDNETRQVVLDSIKRLGYKISKKQSRTASSGKKKKIGMVLADIREEFFAELTTYLELMLKKSDYNLIFCDAEQNSKKELSAINTLIECGVEGLILSPTDTSHDYALLKEQNVPTILIDRNITSNSFDFVGIDNFRSTLEATKKLISFGQKNIAFIGNTDNNYTVKERKTGYRLAMQEAGVFNKENILQVAYHGQAVRGKNIFDFIKNNPQLEGIICASSVICHELIGCLNDIYPNNPAKIKIITYDDNKWYNYLKQEVSAIASPTVDIAAVTTELLLNKLKTPFTETVPKKVILDYEFINRF